MIGFLKGIVFIAGILCIAVVTTLLFLTAKEAICNWIAKKKWEYKYKHRFDKKPVAKCYCKDCKYFEEKAEKCTFFRSYHVLDNWFCSSAKPKKYDSEK